MLNRFQLAAHLKLGEHLNYWPPVDIVWVLKRTRGTPALDVTILDEKKPDFVPIKSSDSKIANAMLIDQRKDKIELVCAGMYDVEN